MKQRFINTTVTMDLLSEFELITEEEVQKSNKLYRMFGSEWDVQNAYLSDNLLETSCEE
jgi:hypothetical protein